MSRSLTLLIVLAISCANPTARADVFVLHHGGRIEGQLVNTDQKTRETYVVRTDAGEITLTADQVEQVITKSDAELAYEQWLPKMPASADGNWKMAGWCLKNGLTEFRKRHLEKVIEYDPEHKEARVALGYSHLDGEWIRPDEYMQSRGYVRHKGAWKLPQEIALEEASTDIEFLEKDWRKKIKIWRTTIVKNRGPVADATQNLHQLNDPLAAAGLVDLIGEEDVKPMKILLMETLGRLHSPLAAATFAELAMRDPDTQVRDKAIDLLIDFGGEQAVPILAQGLKDKDNVVVNRAAVALGSIGHPAATLPLIEALSTKHKFIITTGGTGGTNAGFSPDGGGGTFTQGGGPKLVEQTLANRSALEALTIIHRGVNFQFDKQKWKNWYAEKRSPDIVNLRRDE